MSRWSFLLFGGDISDPKVRRMLWRISLASFIFGFFWGYLDGGGEGRTQQESYLLAALLIPFVGVLGYESLHFYKQSDEFVRSILNRASAIGGMVFLWTVLIGGALIEILGLPSPPLLYVGLYAYLIKMIAWTQAVWRTT